MYSTPTNVQAITQRIIRPKSAFLGQIGPCVQANQFATLNRVPIMYCTYRRGSGACDALRNRIGKKKMNSRSDHRSIKMYVFDCNRLCVSSTMFKSGSLWRRNAQLVLFGQSKWIFAYEYSSGNAWRSEYRRVRHFIKCQINWIETYGR